MIESRPGGKDIEISIKGKLKRTILDFGKGGNICEIFLLFL